MLHVGNLTVSYGNLRILRGVSFEVPSGSIVALLGGNGSGKSTTLKTIIGLLIPDEGTIRFENRDIVKLSPGERVAAGLALVPQGRRIFPTLTVLENLKLGAFRRREQRTLREDLEALMTRFPRVRERRTQRGGTLSVGEQQLVAVSRGLMARPRMLLMDEPSSGLAPLLVDEIFRLIREINAEGTTVLLVEQNVHMALSISHYGYILRDGKIAIADESRTLLGREDLVRSYLGS